MIRAAIDRLLTRIALAVSTRPQVDHDWLDEYITRLAAQDD